MARNKIGFDMKAMEDFAAKFDGHDAEFKKAVNSALLVTKREINNNLKSDMNKHQRTGTTKKSIDEDYNVKWEGSFATLKVGFTFNAGLPSIFLMYGTPKVNKDQRLYDDVYGAKIKRVAKKLQTEAMNKVLERIGG